MKLTSTQVQRTLSQFDAQAVPADHPIIDQLSEIFGDHTFFFDANGLNIVEPVKPEDVGQSAHVVNVADWSDPNLTALKAHDPVPTDILIVLGANGHAA